MISCCFDYCRDIFIELCAASGLAGPIKTILNEYLSGRIGNQRMALFFIGLPNQITSHSIIPDIIVSIIDACMELSLFETLHDIINQYYISEICQIFVI